MAARHTWLLTLVEPHLHLDKAMLGADVVGSLDDAVARTAERKAAFTPDDVRARATDVLARAHAAGVTRIRTPVDVDPTVGLTSLDVLLALREEWAGRVAIQVVPFPQEGVAARPGTRDLLVEALRRGADVRVACSSNNVRNAFTPFGTADPFDAALMLGHVQGLDPDVLLDLTTRDAAALLGDPDPRRQTTTPPNTWSRVPAPTWCCSTPRTRSPACSTGRRGPASPTSSPREREFARIDAAMISTARR